MKLLSRTFDNMIVYCNSGTRYDWVHAGIEHLRLCSDTMSKFVDIPEGVDKIEVVLTTDRVSPHSLAITKKIIKYNIGYTFHTTVYLMLIDGEQIPLTANIEYMLSEYLNKYQKIFATIYYEE